MWQKFPASTSLCKAQSHTITNCGLFYGEIDAAATSSVTALSQVRAKAVPVAPRPALGGAPPSTGAAPLGQGRARGIERPKLEELGTHQGLCDLRGAGEPAR